MKGIGALRRGDWGMFSVSLQHMGTQRERDRLPTRKGAPTRARPSGGLISDFQPPEM